ncbi:MAG: ABC transporter permease subunit [Spirochaetaceae bacterium]|jgi:NitT/TauT family transport system permease protein|nr:ABC transporter permease subunit [Spirochaetaceae bacterium]
MTDFIERTRRVRAHGHRFYFRLCHILLLLFLAIQFLPDKVGSGLRQGEIIFVLALELLCIVVLAFGKNKRGMNLFRDNLFCDIVSFLYLLLIIWELLTAKFNILKPSFFPPPGAVFEQAVRDGPIIFENIGTSLGIVVQGYLLALIVAIPLGLFLGWSVRLGSAATYISKFLSSIPPVVYIPYGIALLPTFRSVSVMVIFLASFWPALAGTMSGVLNVEREIIDSGRSLNVGKLSMLFQIILPASLSQIFIGCNQGLSVSFILLTSAEMIGARSGLGYYVKNFSDLGDYTRIITGVLVIGIVVTIVVFFFNKLQQFLLRWKSSE